jgi:hypothetical protein
MHPLEDGLREARFPYFQAHLRSTRQHRRPSPAPSGSSGSAERHPIASPPPEPIGSAMSYDADLVRASRLMPLVKEGFAASLTEAATRFAISHPVMGTILVGMATPQRSRMRSPRSKRVRCRTPRLNDRQRCSRDSPASHGDCRDLPGRPALRHRADRHHSPPLGSGTPAVSSGGQLVASIDFVGHYPAGRVAVQHRQAAGSFAEVGRSYFLAFCPIFPDHPVLICDWAGCSSYQTEIAIPTPSRATSSRKGVLVPVPKSA